MTHKRVLTIIFISISILSISTTAFSSMSEDKPVVHGVLFYSTTCPHCETVINQVLPPLVAQYGSQLVIHGIDIGGQQGSDLYDTAVETFNISPENQGVPTLIIGDRVMVGSRQIPDELPGVIEEGIAAGGVPWPEIPGLAEIVNAPPPDNTGEESSSNPGENAQEVTIEFKNSWVENFKADLAGNILSVIALAGMIITSAFILVNLRHIPETHPAPRLSWLTPVLSLIGLGVAGYLSFVEITRTDAICGPVGHCNTVQQSPYATLFGFLPVGLLGFLGYIGIILTWLLNQYGPSSWKRITATLLWVFLAFGTLFSIYLTFLEPFVIGASCMWCLTSAVIMTFLFWLNTHPLKLAWRENVSPAES